MIHFVYVKKETNFLLVNIRFKNQKEKERKKRKESVSEKRGKKMMHGNWPQHELMHLPALVQFSFQLYKGSQFYKIVHFFCLFGGGAGHRTARMASSNTFFRPFCVSAEHSRYLTAPISFCIWRLWEYEIGAMFFWRSRATVSGSSRRSSFVPTKIMGVLGAWWLISGYHYITIVNTAYSCLAENLPNFLPWSLRSRMMEGWQERSR